MLIRENVRATLVMQNHRYRSESFGKAELGFFEPPSVRPEKSKGKRRSEEQREAGKGKVKRREEKRRGEERNPARAAETRATSQATYRFTAVAVG